MDTPPGYVLITFPSPYAAADANMAITICEQAGWVLTPRHTNPHSMFTRCDVETALSDRFLDQLRGLPGVIVWVSIRDPETEEPPVTRWILDFLSDGYRPEDLAQAGSILQEYDLGGLVLGKFPPTLNVSTWDSPPGYIDADEVTEALLAVPYSVLQVSVQQRPPWQWRAGQPPIHKEPEGQSPAIVWQPD